MSDDQDTSAPLRTLLAMAALVIVLAGIKASMDMMVPFLLATFIAIIAGSPVYWLSRHRVPLWLSILIVIALLLLVLVGIGALVGRSITDFTQQLPEYQARVRGLMGQGIDFLNAWGVEIDQTQVLSFFDPAVALSWAGRLLSGFTGALSNGFLILLTVIFILLEASSFPRKLRQILADPDSSLPVFERFAADVKRYMAIKTAVSMATGVLISTILTVIGVDFALLWGLTAFLLNYIPTIGSIIAAVPAVLLALVQLGPGGALATALGFAFTNVFLGNVVEPRFMGRGLGLSTTVVFVSLVFWGYLLGPVGMLLSVPLTMTVKIALEVNPGTRWMAILLGPEAAIEPTSPATDAEPSPNAQDEQHP